MRGVIDRFEGTFAVLVLADERRLDVPRSLLPEGVGEGDHVVLTLDDAGEVTAVAYDAEATSAAWARIAEKLTRLRRGEHLRGEGEG